ncbi:MAG: MFS transporter [Firmicutes bacterium]|nr:MFS transporter [Bacillota bacterium]
MLKAFYFAYFVAFGIYSPYLNLYFKQQGLSGAQIGIINMIIPLVAMVIPPLAGQLADKSNQRRYLLAGMVIFSIPFLVMLEVSHSFPWAVALMLAFSILSSPVAPVADGVTLEMLGQNANRYGSIRVWGSIGYAAAVFGIGKVLEVAGWGTVFALYSVMGLSAGVLALRLPERSGAQKGLPSGQEPPRLLIKPLLTNGRLATFLVIAFLARASATTYYNFFSIYLDNLGIRTGLIGLSWTIGVISEIAVVIFFSSWILEHIGPEVLYLAGLAGTALRWYLYSAVTSPGAILFTQLLHGLTFAAFQIGAVSIVNELTPAGLKASGQSLLSAITVGLAGVMGAFGGGLLYDMVGLRPLFALSGGIALIATLLFVLWASPQLRRIQPREPQPREPRKM